MSNYACYLGVKKKVAAVNSALRGWSVFDSLKFPAKVCGPISHNTFKNSRRLFIRLKYVINNNNNKAFKSQTSWGRLELKPSRSNQGSGT